MKSGKFNHFFVYTASAIMSILFAFWVRSNAEAIFLSKKLASSQGTGPVAQETDSEQSASTIANNLLTDSILTIIQNYYVDDSRVRSMELLENGLYYLTENRKYNLNIAGSSYVLSSGDKSIELEIERPFDYNQLLDHSFRISRFITKIEGLEKTYKEDYWQDKGTFKFLNTVLHSLDPHSSLLDASEYDELRQGTEGTFGGLGVVVSFDNSMLRVIKTIENSPAESVGIKPGNLIVSINGRNTFGLSLDEIISLMRGESGTKVNLTVLEDGAFSAKNVTIHRKVVRVNSVEEEIVFHDQKKFLKLYIESFSSSTADEVDHLVKVNSDVDGVILDLRSNPGGLLDQAVKLSDLFLEKGDIVSTQGRYEEVERARYSVKDYSYPLAVLINSDTASASEIVAGSLKDNNRAVIIGQPSFGKGSVQTVFELPGGQALKLTVARYYTPAGTSIQNVGVYPDIWMQGIQKSSQNMNMMGNNRYLEERFLANSLKTKVEESVRKSKYKFYYIEDDKDYVLAFSKKLLSNISEKYGSNIDTSYMRSSLWLARNHKFISKEIERSERAVNLHLRKYHKINWGKETSLNTSALKLVVDELPKSSYKEGELIKIGWRLTNSSQNPMERISIVLKEGREWGRTFEKLVGTVPARTVIKGTLEVPLPDVNSSEEITYNLSYAKSSVYSVDQDTRFNVLVNQIEEPEISYQVKLVDSDGKSIDSLKPGSHSFIEIDIQNNSSIDLKDFQYQVFNLAGRQVKLGVDNSSKNRAKNLRSHDNLKVRLPIESSYNLTSRRVKFGLQLQALNSVYRHNKVIELSISEAGNE